MTSASRFSLLAANTGAAIAALILVACCRAESSAPAATKCDFTISVPSNQKLGALPFTFPLPVSHKSVSVFFSPTQALIVTGLTIDGKPSLGKHSQTRVHFYGPETTSVQAEAYTYVVPVLEGLSFVPAELASSPEPEFATVRFSSEWSEIELRYKIRFPDMTFTRELVLRVKRVRME